MKAAVNNATARPATERRMRRARRSIAARRARAIALALSCSGVGADGRREGAVLWRSIGVIPIEIEVAWDSVSAAYVGVPLSEPGRSLCDHAHLCGRRAHRAPRAWGTVERLSQRNSSSAIGGTTAMAVIARNH